MRKSTDYDGAGIPWTDHDRFVVLDFAYDVALLAKDERQVATTHLTQETVKIGMRIKVEKSKSMPVGLVGPMGSVTGSNTPLEGVNRFTYLCVVCRNNDTKSDTCSRIGKLSAVFCGLQPMSNFGYITLSFCQLSSTPAKPGSVQKKTKMMTLFNNIFSSVSFSYTVFVAALPGFISEHQLRLLADVVHVSSTIANTIIPILVTLTGDFKNFLHLIRNTSHNSQCQNLSK
ncbi:hypothetical protein DPX16_21173 [Anabarilius grahami]|uniref:Reverse transcriptase domain-containing protein n=1 Tax=Anabarilius grahami TaxID=495550 RepID=A0A3N0Z2Q6_ANAGA|nr:hypothetical protein DPX16_21173 [Anabarilius grahami]